MGTWGFGVAEDDTVRDVLGIFDDRLKGGATIPEATAAVLREFESALNDEDEKPLIWLALAKSQWAYGALDPEVLDHVRRDIDVEVGLGRWREESKATLAKRKAALQRFLARIEELNPRPKKVPKLRVEKPARGSKKPPPYPFRPRSTSYLLSGQFWSVPLCNGRFACGRVLQVPSEISDPAPGFFLAGLMDWIGDEPPTADAIAGCSTIAQCEAHISTIQKTGGEILGYRSLVLDGLEPWLFRNAMYNATAVLKGMEPIRPPTEEERTQLPVRGCWLNIYIKLLAEKHFGAQSDNK